MKHRTKFIALAAVLALSGFAFAWGSWSLTIGGFLGNLVAKLLPVEEVGSTLYDVQEGTHELVTDTTGIEVPHYYIWVCTGDECVPVDPLRFSN